MALIGNITILARIPCTRTGGVLANERSNFNQSGRNNNFFFGEAGIDDKGGLPSYGYNDVYGWQLPWEAGGVGCRGTTEGLGSVTGANAAGGVNLESAIAGIGTLISPSALLIVSAVSTITGSGVITDAAAKAFLSALASLSGSGAMDGDITAISFAIASLAGIGATSSPTATALGVISADITPYTELSPQSLSDAVWSALTSQYSAAGTMGKALSDAGGAGNPWAAPLIGNDDPGSFGELVQLLGTVGSDTNSDITTLTALVNAAKAKLDELHLIQGLTLGSPMTVTPTHREVGSISLEITGDGETTSTVTRV